MLQRGFCAQFRVDGGHLDESNEQDLEIHDVEVQQSTGLQQLETRGSNRMHTHTHTAPRPRASKYHTDLRAFFINNPTTVIFWIQNAHTTLTTNSVSAHTTHTTNSISVHKTHVHTTSTWNTRSHSVYKIYQWQLESSVRDNYNLLFWSQAVLRYHFDVYYTMSGESELYFFWSEYWKYHFW